ncbi:MAG: sodium:proton antiporter [Holosporaceae bacterium]|jgi:Na+/H+ antiporter NhaD/arsenite permease-like protein|nr:sodium:proton antiporter [Holosporaceae bacterium]
MQFSSLLWSIPFFGIIISVSILPLLCQDFWHRNARNVIAGWLLLYLIAIGYVFGPWKIFEAVFEPITAHYVPFFVLIFSLYVVSGGIFVDFPRGYGPLFNVCFLFFSGIIAGWIGTTGAATLLIRPFLRANAERKYQSHLVVFFIFIVANIGGVATPLGDPPLFIGFLEGVDFFWFLKNLYPFLLGTLLLLCFIFFTIDYILFKKFPSEHVPRKDAPYFVINGSRNLLLVAVILVITIYCNFDGTFMLCEEKFHYDSMVRNILLLAVAFISLKITPATLRKKNHFFFGPVVEVGEFFAGIFITVTPIIFMLHRGVTGEFGPIFDWMSAGDQFIASRCFWASGILSSILDNAPTFLIFFHMLSGKAMELMTVKSHLLMAISIATVFMGALTYIGNAPNLMVRSISVYYGVRPPSFMMYMLWSSVILLPVFFVISCLL